VHLEGHVTQKKHKKRVAPLEHMVHPEGHVALMWMKETNLNIPKTIMPNKFLNIIQDYTLKIHYPYDLQPPPNSRSFLP
jgi:hypothetical protein